MASSLLNRSLSRPLVGKSTLFICDVQEVFRPRIFNMPTVIQKTELVNNVCNIMGIPAVITEHYTKAFGHTVPEITKYPGTKVFAKTRFSMLIPELKNECLTEKKQIILVGIEAHACVLQTTLDLLTEGHEVFLVCDAISSQRPHDRAVALQRMKDSGAVLMTAESLIFDLMREATHPNFKQISGLIKTHNENPTNHLFGEFSTL